MGHERMVMFQVSGKFLRQAAKKYTLHRQNVVHLKRQEQPWAIPTLQTECGPSQKARAVCSYC